MQTGLKCRQLELGTFTGLLAETKLSTLIPARVRYFLGLGQMSTGPVYFSILDGD